MHNGAQVEIKLRHAAALALVLVCGGCFADSSTQCAPGLEYRYPEFSGDPCSISNFGYMPPACVLPPPQRPTMASDPVSTLRSGRMAVACLESESKFAREVTRGVILNFKYAIPRVTENPYCLAHRIA
jgi:hypothetical protein